MGIHDHPTRKLGLLPTDPAKPILEIDRVLTGILPPPSEDRYAGVAFGLDGNDKFGDCITPETRVLRADLRWVPARTLNVGDKLLAFDEEPQGSQSAGRRFKEATVECVDVVQRPCYELEWEDGTVVRSSSGHRWLTRSSTQGQLGCQRWAETQHLKLGPVRQSQVVKPLSVWADDRSYEAGYLAGAFDGEGNLELTRHGAYANRLCFSQTENEMLERVEGYLADGGYEHRHTVTSGGTATCVDGSPRKTKHRLAVSTRQEWLRFLGSVRPARLLPKVEVERLGRIHGGTVRLVRKDFIGEQDVVMLDTSARTYFAEGLASHNCGPTSVDNHRRSTSKVATGQQRTATLQQVYGLYRQSGNPNFDPTKENTEDQGVEMGTMLDALLRFGLGGDKPVAFGRAKATDDATIEKLVAVFGGVLFAVNLLEAQQAQSSAQPPKWSYQQSPEWGGHAVYCGKYAPWNVGMASSGVDAPVISWAEEIETDDSFRSKQLEEVWVIIWPWHLEHPAFLVGVDQAKLAEVFKELTGKTLPLPPAPTPTPTPPPAPPPAPIIEPGRSYDATLWEHVKAWSEARHIDGNRRAAEAVRAWAKAKGLT
jgi:hypothetical protein